MKTKRFVVLFNPKLSEETKKLFQDMKDLTEKFKKECMEINDCSTCLIRSACPIINTDIMQCMFGSAETDDKDQIEEIVDRTKEIFDPTTIVVLDSDEDVCFIYKAEKTLAELKKTELPQLLTCYEKAINTYPFLGTVEDMR